MGFLEEQIVNKVKKQISNQDDPGVKAIRDKYGEEGLLEYLVGSDLDPRPGQTNVLGPQVAKKYYERSASKGHPMGQFALSLVYLQGTHQTDKDYEIGSNLMKSSAKQGFGPALYNRARWLIDGTMGCKKDPSKAYRMLGKAKKDPLLDEVAGAAANVYILLATMRLQGLGCTKNPESAQDYLDLAEKSQPGRVPQSVMDMCKLLLGISGVSKQREADLRWRRLKVALRSAGPNLTLNEWAGLYSYYGLPFSVSPSSHDQGSIVMNHDEMMSWKIRVHCLEEMPEMYPASDDPLPPLECDNVTCHLDETQISGKMKKCSECQAPYCSEACQRADWSRHKPVCAAISANINNEGGLTDHEKDFMEREGIEKLRGMGLTDAKISEAMSSTTAGERKCEHDQFGIPCGRECLAERGAITQKRHNYFLVQDKQELTPEQVEEAIRLGLGEL